ncbi:MAG: nucleoside recognition protein [Syntrophomonadaceae bacterium]|nr:nucleoside recognition protein [Syntrophomonadaceae bacterium]
MSLLMILSEAAKGSFSSILQIAIIVIPLMVFIEILIDLKLLDKLTAVLVPLTRIFNISQHASLPLMAGMVFGISYGGGIIINAAREGKLDYREIYLVNLFLIMCHSLFEDTFLFAAIGAQWIPVLTVRIILAVLICFLFSRYTRGNQIKQKTVSRLRDVPN